MSQPIKVDAVLHIDIVVVVYVIGVVMVVVDPRKIPLKSDQNTVLNSWYIAVVVIVAVVVVVFVVVVVVVDVVVVFHVVAVDPRILPLEFG